LHRPLPPRAARLAPAIGSKRQRQPEATSSSLRAPKQVSLDRPRQGNGSDGIMANPLFQPTSPSPVLFRSPLGESTRAHFFRARGEG
jgi:hypothetical protein